MLFHTSIGVEHLGRLVGTARVPLLIDLRDRAASDDARIIPASLCRPAKGLEAMKQSLPGQLVVCICRNGRSESSGAAAWLRSHGIEAQFLEGGFEAWRDAGQPLTRVPDNLPRNGQGQTMWVTRERPKIDRIACPWLIRRFVDPGAILLFVPAPDVQDVAAATGATPFDIDGVFWSHRADTCTFDTMLMELELANGPLLRLATIVRAADTARLDLAPQAAGLLAISLGLSKLFDDDLAQLDAGMALYDALYLWCRDAAGETHTWPGKTEIAS